MMATATTGTTTATAILPLLEMPPDPADAGCVTSDAAAVVDDEVVGSRTVEVVDTGGGASDVDVRVMVVGGNVKLLTTGVCVITSVTAAVVGAGDGWAGGVGEGVFAGGAELEAGGGGGAEKEDDDAALENVAELMLDGGADGGAVVATVTFRQSASWALAGPFLFPSRTYLLSSTS